MELNPKPEPAAARRSPWKSRMLNIGGAGIVAGLVAIGGTQALASAQAADDPAPVESTETTETTETTMSDAVTGSVSSGLAFDGDGPDGARIDRILVGPGFGADLSPEDQAIFDEFDACMSDAFGALDQTEDSEKGHVEMFAFDDEDWASIQADIEACEAGLEGLSDDVSAIFDAPFIGEMDLSPEDEAVFDEFESCLETADECDTILDGLSEDASFVFGGPMFGEFDGDMFFDFDHFDGCDDPDAEDYESEDSDLDDTVLSS